MHSLLLESWIKKKKKEWTEQKKREGEMANFYSKTKYFLIALCWKVFWNNLMKTI